MMVEENRVLVAEDDSTCRRILEVSLGKWGYDVVSCTDGLQAWTLLEEPEPPHIAIVDWMMPGIDGVELCRRAREHPSLAGMYIILVTSRGSRQDVLEGLWSGADDYVVKPFDLQEMQARVRVGTRVVALQKNLADRVAELERAASNIKQLQGLLPICSYCKSIRNDRHYWEKVEQYISEHSGAQFTHGICPSCFQKVMAEVDAVRNRFR